MTKLASKICPKCFRLGKNFNKDKTRLDGLANRCTDCMSLDHKEDYLRNKECIKARVKIYSQRNPDKELMYTQRKRKKYPEKYRARNILANAIRSRTLCKSEFCSECKQSSSKLEAHHPDYSKPYKVIWLCSQCHTNLHMRVT